MTGEGVPQAKRQGRLAGLILVVLGVLTIAQGGVISYPGAGMKTIIWIAASMILGAVLILLGYWVSSRNK